MFQYEIRNVFDVGLQLLRLQQNETNHLTISKDLILNYKSLRLPTSMAAGWYSLIVSSLETLPKYSESLKLSSRKQFIWQQVMVKSSLTAQDWFLLCNSLSAAPLFSFSSPPQMLRHYSIAKATAIIEAYQLLWRFRSTIGFSFLSLPTTGSHYLILLPNGSNRFLYSSKDLRYFPTSSVAVNSGQPSIMKGLPPFRLTYKASSWLRSCLTTINLRPKVNLPESDISGKRSLNLLRKRIQLR